MTVEAGEGGSRRDPEELAAAAGQSVTEHVRALLTEAERSARSVVEDAQAEADRVRTEAQGEADATYAAALSAANEILTLVGAVEERLGEVVAELRAGATALPGALAAPTGDETAVAQVPPSAVPGVAFDVGQIAANLREIMEQKPARRPPPTDAGDDPAT